MRGGKSGAIIVVLAKLEACCLLMEQHKEIVLAALHLLRVYTAAFALVVQSEVLIPILVWLGSVNRVAAAIMNTDSIILMTILIFLLPCQINIRFTQKQGVRFSRHRQLPLPSSVRTYKLLSALSRTLSTQAALFTLTNTSLPACSMHCRQPVFNHMHSMPIRNPDLICTQRVKVLKRGKKLTATESIYQYI